MPIFTRAPTADTAGITIRDEIEVAPAQVARSLGPPPIDNVNGYKTSAEYIFLDERGRVFTLSDWLATSLWDPEFPSPEEYWANEEPDELVIMAIDDDVTEFRKWVLSQLQAS